MLVQNLFLALLAVGSTAAWKFPIFHFAKVHTQNLGSGSFASCAAVCPNGAAYDSCVDYLQDPCASVKRDTIGSGIEMS
ncbi:uncharacterized protein PAC_19095 [Phialocephala subalpina]|uniref:Uncharacterized protein n=1 Tax=Phialocephala subalpina TaxID=576137 RepID=A0A1L7XW37_9HELO|nr:uncharacterized protein PAC_19095 [Phialocephala subalpina]